MPIKSQIPKRITLLSFIVSELILVFIIIILGVKIYYLFKDKIMGIQYVTVLKKEDLIFDDKNKVLKYFYEPKANKLNNNSPEWLGYKVVNTINKDSLNERYDYTLDKPDGIYRIITLGDSLTFGLYVNTKDNYSEVLEDLLNNRLLCNKKINLKSLILV